MLNFFIKNTFINIVDTCAQDEEAGREANEGRRTRSAPPKMRSPPEDGPGSPRVTIAEDTEMADQVVEGSSEASEDGESPEENTTLDTIDSEADEQGGEGASVIEDITGSMPGHTVADAQRIRPSVLLRQQERMIDQFLDEQISIARAEKWDALSRGLVDFCTQKYSLSALRIDMLVPKRRLVISKLSMMHIARFTGLTAEMINVMKEKGMLREKDVTMEVWVAKRDASNRELRVFLSAAIRFQKAFDDRQLLVQYRGELSNWSNPWYPWSLRPILIPCGPLYPSEAP